MRTVGAEISANGDGALDADLVLSGSMTLQCADDIHARLLERAGEPTLEIDCSGVTEADLSLVQLILAARVSAQRAGRTVRLAHPASGILLQVLEQGGFLQPGGDRPTQDQAFWLHAGKMA